MHYHFHIGDPVFVADAQKYGIVRTGPVVQIYITAPHFYDVLIDGRLHLVHERNMRYFIPLTAQEAEECSDMSNDRVYSPNVSLLCFR